MQSNGAGQIKCKTGAEVVITAPNLEPHVEGGYLRRTFQSDHRDMYDTIRGPRYLLTSIYFLPDGSLQTCVMGSNLPAGQHLQLHVPVGVWKASQLLDGPNGFSLISEAVSPGFDFPTWKWLSGRNSRCSSRSIKR